MKGKMVSPLAWGITCFFFDDNLRRSLLWKLAGNWGAYAELDGAANSHPSELATPDLLGSKA